MRPLLVCSLEAAAGKTALSIGLARRFWKDGLRVGYLKAMAPGQTADGDAEFVRAVLELPEPTTVLAPVALEADRPAQLVERLRASLVDITARNDLVLIEGGNTLAEGARIGMSAPELAGLLEAKALLVLRYRSDMLDGALVAARSLGQHLAGVVVNTVPPSQLAKAKECLLPALEQAGVPVLGMVPQDRVLLGATVRDLAEQLNASVVCCPEGTDEVVERLMIGAMSVDGARVYFRKHANKAVITGGDRPDIQLAALETPTRCLILTGGFPVDPMVMERAREVGVPILVTEHDTLDALEAIHDVLGSSRFRQKAKVGRLDGLVADNIDLAELRAKLEG